MAYLLNRDETSTVAYRNYWEKYLENVDLLVNDSGKETCRGGHEWGPGKREYLVVHKVLNGKGIFIVNGVHYEIKTGDVFYFGANDLVYYQADADDPLDYIWVSFTGTKAKFIMDATIFSKQNKQVDSAENTVQKGIEKIFDIMASGGNVYSATGALYELLGNMVDCFGNDENLTSTESVGLAYVNNAILYIEANYKKVCTTAILSEFLGLTRAYVYKLFKLHTGVSPTAYIENFRMKKACELLNNGRITVSECALLVGYQDSAYFSRVFKKVNGIYPKEYILNSVSKVV